MGRGSGGFVPGAVNEFKAVAERVRELALTLPDPITVMVADYVGDYLE